MLVYPSQENYLSFVQGPEGLKPVKTYKSRPTSKDLEDVSVAVSVHSLVLLCSFRAAAFASVASVDLRLSAQREFKMLVTFLERPSCRVPSMSKVATPEAH